VNVSNAPIVTAAALRLRCAQPAIPAEKDAANASAALLVTVLSVIGHISFNAVSGAEIAETAAVAIFVPPAR
jgi:hypothetical protein